MFPNAALSLENNGTWKSPVKPPQFQLSPKRFGETPTRQSQTTRGPQCSPARAREDGFPPRFPRKCGSLFDVGLSRLQPKLRIGSSVSTPSRLCGSIPNHQEPLRNISSELPSRFMSWNRFEDPTRIERREDLHQQEPPPSFGPLRRIDGRV
ncbi:hypothetical protein VTK26DRAFT_6281 [Humicola hyalothermophila]